MSFFETGFEILPDVLSASECEALIQAIAGLASSPSGKSAGIRNLLRNCSLVAELVSSEKISTLLQSRVGQKTFPVRALYFDKTERANWLVPWHQDLTIAVAERVETDGFGPWSVKAGVTHVQPPREVLEQMIALRLHLDDCHEANGALRVIPRSHLYGKLGSNEISRQKTNSPMTVCEVPRGGALLMRPLLLHSSSPAKKPSHRRVIHVEYAVNELPNGLSWFDH